MPRFFKVVGHRGMRSRYPENTIPSFLAAIDAGVDALEFDVYPTSDRRLVITHDPNIDRCSNGSGPVVEHSFEELRALDFGSWKGPEFAGTRIPTLEETLDAITGRSSTLEILIELKADDERCALAVLDEIRRRRLQDRTIVLSFYANLLKLLHQEEPALRVQGFRLEDFRRPEPDVYDYLHRLCIWRHAIDAEAVKRFHEMGIEVDVCPVDDAEQLDAITELDVDTITTNAPDVIMPLLRERGLRPPRLPKTYTAWRLHGTGMEQFWKEELPLPEPGPEEMLVRVDAVGLCFSDIKIIRAGASHPKLWWNNLDERPLVPGHEAVLTVMKTGGAVPLRYAPGQKFLIQCDIYLKGRSCAYGYGMDGAYARYGLIDARVWRGEGRSYLLDFPESLSGVATALIEPWSCVRGSYRIGHRTAPLAGGRTLIAAMPDDREIYRAGELFRESRPAEIAAWNLSDAAVKALEQELDLPVKRLQALPEQESFDDIFCCNLVSKSLLEAAAALAGRGGVVNFLGRVPRECCRIDVGALHYQNRYYQGASSGELSSLYRSARRTGLKPGGRAWFPGGAGAMGQMHVELALTAPDGPSEILVSDIDNGRISHLAERLAPRAAALGRKLEFLNPVELGPERFAERLSAFAPQGFDDVVLLIPNAAAVEQAAGFLNDGALVNLFAGIPAGETAPLPIQAIVERQVRFTGSSGSSFDDMADTLRAAAAGEFQPQCALAAIGGMDALKEGLEAVAAGRFPGKTAILPGCPKLPLTALSELGRLDPDLPATLDEHGNYTRATEAMLLAKWGEENAEA